MTIQIEVKERPILFSGPMVRAILENKKTQTRRVVKAKQYAKFEEDTIKYAQADYHAGPYGKPGDLLWVRETWLEDRIPELPKNIHGCVHYRANGYTYQEVVDSWDGHWKPSIFMPRWASRITLEITSVRVERLQDISEADAIAEGMYTNEAAIKKLGLPADTKLTGSCVDKYRIVWESINGKKYPWSTNPFVWVVEFRRVMP